MDPVPHVRSRTECLAHWIWLQRGKPEGSADGDWFLAEALLAHALDRARTAPREPSLFAYGIERCTR